MKMKLTSLLLFIAVTHALFSQSVSIDITGGYCAPIASTFSSVNAREFQNATFPYYYSTFQSMKSTSYGQGGSAALNFNWFSKKDIGCGLRANILFSAPFSSTADVTYLNGVTAAYNFTDKPFSFQFIPHISFKHDFKVVTPVLEMGMLIGITHVTEDYTALYSNGNVIQSSINNHGGALLGFYSSLGIAIKMSKAVKFLLAVNCSVGSYSPTQWDRTSFFVNGQDQLNNLNTIDVKGIYVKQLDRSVSQSPSQPTSQPSQDLKYSVPFSNVGFSAGFAFTFGKKKGAGTTPEKDSPKEKKDNTIHPF